MKKLLILLSFVTALFSAPVFYSYEKGLEFAQKNDKSLLVVVEQDYCPWCERFKKVLKQKRAKEVLDKKFVLVFLNNKDDIPTQFVCEIAPYSFIVDNKGETLLEIMGYVNEDKLLQEIELAFEEL